MYARLLQNSFSSKPADEVMGGEKNHMLMSKMKSLHLVTVLR